MKKKILLTSLLGLTGLVGGGIIGFTTYHHNYWTNPISAITKTAHAQPTSSTKLAPTASLTIKLGSAKNLDSGAKINLKWWNTTDTKTSPTATLLDAEKFGGLEAFIKKYPTVTIKLVGGSAYDNFMSFVGIGYDYGWKQLRQGNHFYAKTFKTTDLWGANSSTKTLLNSYNYGDTFTYVEGKSYLNTGIVKPSTGSSALLTINSEAFVLGRAGPSSKWDYAFSWNVMTDIIFS